MWVCLLGVNASVIVLEAWHHLNVLYKVAEMTSDWPCFWLSKLLQEHSENDYMYHAWA